MEETKRCPYCGEEILATAKKCRYCGEWLEKVPEEKKMIACPVCGEEIEENTTVCPYCHEKINGETPQKTSYQDAEERGEGDNPSEYTEDGEDDEKPVSFFMAYAIEPFYDKIFKFKGKATCKEYWLSMLCLFFFVFLIEYMEFVGLFSHLPHHYEGIPYLLELLLLIGQLAITSRRLEDTGKSWTWLFIYLIPIAGIIWMIVLCCLPGVKKDRHVQFKILDGVVVAVYIIAFSIITSYAIYGKDFVPEKGQSSTQLVDSLSDDTLATDTAGPAYPSDDTEDTNTTSDDDVSFSGYIGNKYPVEMELTITRGENRNTYKGKYKYEGQSDWLVLIGTSDPDGKNLYFDECDSYGNITGTFEGTENEDGSLSGTFTNSSSQQFSFYVSKDD